MARILRVGLVGCGNISRAHVAAYRKLKDVKIAGVYDIIRQAAVKLAEEVSCPVAESLEELADKMKVDAVSICSPPAAHFENCRPLLKRKIAVLCEKPLEVDATQAEVFAKAVRKSGALFMVAYCHRFHGPILELKRLLDTDVLGKPLLLRNIFAGYFAVKGNHRANPVLSGGGCLADNCAHSVDLFRFLVGEPTQIEAMIGNLMQDLPIEDFSMLHLSAHGEAFGEILSSYPLPVGSAYVELYASKGTAVISYGNPGVPEFSYHLVEASDSVVVDCSKHPPRFETQIKYFVQCIRQGLQPSVTVEDGLKSNRIVSAAYEFGSNEATDGYLRRIVHTK